MSQKRALISVFNKEEVVEFAKNLENLGWEIVSTGGTSRFLKRAGIKVTPIEKITGRSEILDGRVKTIAYQIAAGLLFDRKKPKHRAEIKKSNIKPIDMVVCSLYPFEKTVSGKHSLEEAVEMIDIGGVTLLRAAAKNYEYVTVVTDPKYYPLILRELEKVGEVSLETKKRLASKVFWKVADYDAAIDVYLAKRFCQEEIIKLNFCEGKKLRYGENPHLAGWFYKTQDPADPLAISDFKFLQGKEVSFNNTLDISAAIDLICEIGQEKPSCAILKHGSPCGAATKDSIHQAYHSAWYEGDPLAAFGGIVIVNRLVDEKLARKMLFDRGQKKFFEVLLAPKVEVAALNFFGERKNLIILENPTLEKPKIRKAFDFKFVRGGILKGDFDSKVISEKDLKIVSKQRPTKKQIEDLLFAFKIVKASRSNAVAIAKNQTLISSGVGQQDRKEACKLAVFKSADPSRGKSQQTAIGAVAASDGFFPFADGPEILIKAGIKAIIQPGGSLRDQETINLCNRHKVALVFTGVRAFKH
ncbi:MAG: bifunctional phosphoribosylaminoimidazolecarboxamide formyltransferase/IMP cyclohydrolase [Candidatus Woykebacteria bacterium GWA1_44_8]|uniref:Bifunctional purine biosynthesis protein PurH n=1 Tax=Candidatus Woykebacteria bacterium GWA1_44_8 TaxID=1802591 RepID=A0A1G1W211_9BACT|nr:MAG: bifunctional phosphoribosylaminoimidazolecarboxamide formyltransferase/IMP cyclohydrolase [Candidatus Woykebacteria bacterium GWA1_44_8]